ncbi:GLABROUS1 enhancer-binding protein-like 2 isoform X2 [Lycium ferocissimum]|uniref:GLABROUS1 enhancer-binding protein-like 2 isoform X2 n=1 Tax=Lycium ferocissimum TaxID=112874 RepID=UPI002815E263|nr:GLABROUS1 enhancer-binding protein-like 2 isoform X2 [Lycium ferocissimum]
MTNTGGLERTERKNPRKEKIRKLKKKKKSIMPQDFSIMKLHPMMKKGKLKKKRKSIMPQDFSIMKLHAMIKKGKLKKKRKSIMPQDFSIMKLHQMMKKRKLRGYCFLSMERNNPKKEKNKHVEEKESIREKEDKSTTLLYNETLSEQSELPSLKRVKTKKPPPFSKVWSDKDEITVLKDMIKFKKETGPDAAQNMLEFHPLVLKSLVLKATRVQLRKKVRLLKKKYEKSVETGNGYKTVHEEVLFQLCEKIWPVNSKSSSGTGQPEQPNSSGTGQLELPNSSGTGQREQQNVLVNGQWKKHNLPKIGPLGQGPRQHIIIPETGLNGQALEALFERLSKDMELVMNSQACLRGYQKEVDMKKFDLYLDSLKLRIKFEALVLEKANSPELRDSPELLEQEVIRAYLEAKLDLTQQLLNAYNSFSKAPPKKIVASSSKNSVGSKKKDESSDDSSSEKDSSSEEEDHSDEA